MEGETFTDIFERTLRNCEFYEKEKKPNALCNEIGVLRGIMYCMEIVGICPHTDKAMHYIEMQEKFKKLDDRL